MVDIAKARETAKNLREWAKQIRRDAVTVPHATAREDSRLLDNAAKQLEEACIVFDGTDITRLPTHRIIAASIACIPEGRKIFPKFSVEENLRVGAYQEISEAVTRTRMEEVFAIFPRLAQRRTQLAGTMSGGEQAMVSIGRGLMRAPKLLLVDEPSLGLSPLLVKENFNIVRQINERGVTIFLVEQNVHQTLAISQHGYVLSKGRVVAAGTAAELADRAEVREAYFG